MMSSFSSKQRFHLLASLLHAVKNSVTIKEIYSCMANMKKTDQQAQPSNTTKRKKTRKKPRIRQKSTSE